MAPVQVTKPLVEALRRLLVPVVGSHAAVEATLVAALRRSGRGALPDDCDDLLRFVRAHLAPAVGSEVGPRLALAVVEDLEALIEQERARGDMTSSPRLKAATAAPAPLGPAEASPAADLEPRFPRLRASLARLERITAPQEGVPETGRKGQDVAQRVLLVEANVMGRANTARALVRAGYDVHSFRSLAEVGGALGLAEVLVIVAGSDDLPGALSHLGDAPTGVSVVVCTDSPTAAQSLQAAGVRRFRITKTSYTVAKQLRELLSEPLRA